MRDIKRIYIHTSASSFGDDDIINYWHRQRGFKNLWKYGGFYISDGYHFIILNGNVHPKEPFLHTLDGQIEVGRRLSQTTAAVKGDNKHTIQICMIGRKVEGKFPFTVNQIRSCFKLCRELQNMFDVGTSNILGHYEFPGVTKTCPDMDMDKFRKTYTIYIRTNNVNYDWLF